MASQSTRRTALPLLLIGGAVCLLNSSTGFVGTQAQHRAPEVFARTSAGYLERQGPKDADVPFKASDATGAEVPIEFKKRPFGILRYQPGEGGKGAMAMEIIPSSRYPGDPQGQAFVAGVKSGWTVKSINGVEVKGEDFAKIMDWLDDEVADPRFSKSTAEALKAQGGRLAEAAAVPVKIVFQEVPGYVYKGKELKADGQDGFAR